MVSHFPKLIITSLFQEVRSQAPCICQLFSKEPDSATEPREMAEQCVRPSIWPLGALSLPVHQQHKLVPTRGDGGPLLSQGKLGGVLV